MEKGLKPIYSERCGSPFATFPFVRVTLYDDFMVTKMWGKDVFEYKNMRFAERYGSITGTGVEINTVNIEKYGYSVIYSVNATNLINLINQKVAAAHHIKPVSFPV